MSVSYADPTPIALLALMIHRGFSFIVAE
jgi:hypothetical protein